MKNKRIFLWCGLLVALGLIIGTTLPLTGDTAGNTEPSGGGSETVDTVNIIFDSDCGPDTDDGGALAMLHGYADRGTVNLLAVMNSTSCEYGAPWADAVNTYYGRPDIPVGTLKSRTDINPTATAFNKYIAQHWENSVINGHFAPDAVDVYRKVLSRAEDGSVTIVCVGMLTNLADLLRSEPDEYSELTGAELVAKKVRLLSCMGGDINGNTEYNIVCDITSAQYVADNWPSFITFSGGELGMSVITGGTRHTDMEEDNPIRKSYDLFCGVDNDRNSWDLTAVLYAVEGLGDYWTLEVGDVGFSDDGHTEFVRRTDGNRGFLVKTMSDNDLADRLNALMTAAKKNNPDEAVFELVDASPDSEGVVFDGEFYNDRAMDPLTYGNTLYFGNEKGSSVSVTFNGTGIDVYAGMNSDNGIVNIYLDGEKVASVDLYYPSKVAAAVIYSATDLENGEHTLKIVNWGRQNEQSSGIFASFDYFKVYKAR